MDYRRLPHPHQIARCPEFSPWQKQVTILFETAADDVATAGGDRNDFFAIYRRLRGAIRIPTVDTVGGFNSVIASEWWSRHSPVLVEASADLLESLSRTDFSRIPAAMFRLPFPAVYLQFPIRQDVSIPESSPPFRDYPVDGVMLIESPPKPMEGITKMNSGFVKAPCADTEFREIFYYIHGSPLALDVAIDDDAIISNSFLAPCHNDTLTLSECVRFGVKERAHLYHGEDGQFLHSDKVVDSIQSTLAQAAKVILYMGLPECRPVRDNAWSRAICEARSKKNPAKREKAIARANAQVYDRIVIGDTTPVSAPGSGTDRKTPRGHWRRGHFHTVLHGEGRKERRVAWFRPIPVAMPKAAPDPRVYEVRAQTRSQDLAPEDRDTPESQ